MSYLEQGSIYSAVEKLGYPILKDQRVDFISQGMDSLVYRVGYDQVLKVYRPNLDLTSGMTNKLKVNNHVAQLKDYERITNKLAELLSRNPVYLKQWWAENLQLVVNPISRMEWSEELGCMVGLSPYVEGDTVLGRYESQIYARKADDVFVVEVEGMNKSLNSMARCRGISIDEINMKYGYSGSTLVITDLCSYVNHLRA